MDGPRGPLEGAGLSQRLQIIRAAVVVSVAALKHQNSDLDADVAALLQRQVADRIDEEIDRLAAPHCARYPRPIRYNRKSRKN